MEARTAKIAVNIKATYQGLLTPENPTRYLVDPSEAKAIHVALLALAKSRFKVSFSFWDTSKTRICIHQDPLPAPCPIDDVVRFLPEHAEELQQLLADTPVKPEHKQVLAEMFDHSCTSQPAPQPGAWQSVMLQGKQVRSDGDYYAIGDPETGQATIRFGDERIDIDWLAPPTDEDKAAVVASTDYSHYAGMEPE
ncbi:hypothetical protein [Ferrimonas marina]|uniref:Uncharacterized protein n=1 Tax=Ferrimonas marina TaxID=299255 RepID=A0A1M5TLK8_9GAMM|nr:hypothetical protein [Ferrimonas marina]SHH51705.1 hypothetical protein SAMN02745129_2197 [Ferrimonas marina]